MKTRWIVSLSLLLAVTLASCDTFSVLEQEPKGSVPADEAITTGQGAEAVLTGAYDQLQGFMDTYTIFAALAADNAQHSGSAPDWQAVDNHNLAATNAEADGQWTSSYELINIANQLIQQVPGLVGAEDGLSQERADAIVGQALALRAFAYHNLVRWFGGVPLVTEPAGSVEDITLPERASKAAVYDRIITDLQEAESKATASNPVGFIDKDVASGLLARVYLYDEQYANAAAKAQELIESDRFSLASLSSIYEDLNSAASIWELQYSAQDANAMAFYAFQVGFGGRYEYAPAADFLTDIDSTGQRDEFNLTVQLGEPVIAKYFRAASGADHHFMLRLAEMYLTRAEALVRSGGSVAEARQLVNAIRNRAGLSSIAPEDFDTREEQLDVILRERRFELAFEGHRWHDLVRTGRAVEVLPTLSNPDFTRWPIPQGEIDVNENLEQNPGY